MGCDGRDTQDYKWCYSVTSQGRNPVSKGMTIKCSPSPSALIPTELLVLPNMHTIHSEERWGPGESGISLSRTLRQESWPLWLPGIHSYHTSKQQVLSQWSYLWNCQVSLLPCHLLGATSEECKLFATGYMHLEVCYRKHIAVWQMTLFWFYVWNPVWKVLLKVSLLSISYVIVCIITVLSKLATPLRFLAKSECIAELLLYKTFSSPYQKKKDYNLILASHILRSALSPRVPWIWFPQNLLVLCFKPRKSHRPGPFCSCNDRLLGLVRPSDVVMLQAPIVRGGSGRALGYTGLMTHSLCTCHFTKPSSTIPASTHNGPEHVLCVPRSLLATREVKYPEKKISIGVLSQQYVVTLR